MAQPKKYHTPEEKRVAKAACMRRSHNARKETVNERRRELYAQKIRRQERAERRAEKRKRQKRSTQEKESGVSLSSETMRTPSASSSTRTNRIDLENDEAVKTALVRVRSIRTSMKQLLMGSIRSYMETRCLWFGVDLHDPRPGVAVEVIELHISKWSKFHCELKPWLDEIYDKAGYNKEYREAEAVLTTIRTVTRYLEDVLSVALVDPDEVKVQYEGDHLLFQKELSTGTM